MVPVMQLLQHPHTRDFGLSFHPSGRAWIEEGRPYAFDGLPNLNPPTVTAAIFVPLALLPLRPAAVVWTLVGVLCLVSTWWQMVRWLPLPRPAAYGSLGTLLCTVGAAGLVWLEGQITWLLVLVTAKAWLAYRAGNGLRTGFWMGLAIAAKPFLAVAILPVGLTPLVVAGAVSIAVSLGSAALTGWASWHAWLSQSAVVDWLGSPGNASLWGLAARWTSETLRSPTTISQFGRPLVLAIAGVAAGGTLWAAFRPNRDVRWTLGLLTATLVSPLGWTHYLPLIAAPLTALWVGGHWNRWLTIGVALLCVPPNVGYGDMAGSTWLGGVTLGSIYNVSALLLWVGVGRLTATRNASAGINV